AIIASRCRSSNCALMTHARLGASAKAVPLAKLPRSVSSQQQSVATRGHSLVLGRILLFCQDRNGRGGDGCETHGLRPAPPIYSAATKKSAGHKHVFLLQVLTAEFGPSRKCRDVRHESVVEG